MAKTRSKKAPAVIIPKAVRNLIAVSDTHGGCRLGLCPREGVRLDDGGYYGPSQFQLKMLGMWEEFWNEWVPLVTRKEPYFIVHVGDALDGVHHNSTTQISQNLKDQADIAYAVLKPIVELCEGRYYHIRGTAAHVGPSSIEEERLAEQLGAIPNEDGQHARYDLWKRVGKDCLVHLLHHIGTTSSSAHESSAVNAELTAEFVEAARWRLEPPDFIVRGHRHRSIAVDMDSAKGYAAAIVTPGWQGKTPFAWKVAGARLATPQFGGILIREGDEEYFYRRKVWTIGRSKEE